MSANSPPPTALDRVDFRSAAATSLAAACLAARLKDSGPTPYSLCEARLSEAEYRWLRDWAWEVSSEQFTAENQFRQGTAGLVLVALLAEWNRRESDGDSVFLGADTLFRVETRRVLFDENRNPRSKTLRAAIREAAARYALRHAFGSDEEATQRWYLTVQLQYGFCRKQIPRLLDWLRGLPPTEAMQRLLAQAGQQRSRSFQRLISDLRLYRRGFQSTTEARRQLEASHWVLPDWVPELLEVTRTRVEDASDESDEGEPPLEAGVTLGWDLLRGPVIWLVPAAPTVDQNAITDRYDLRAGAHLLASWLLQPRIDAGAGEYRTDVRCIELPVGDPELVLRLEDETHETLASQTVPVWDGAAEVQVLRLGATPSAESARWEVGRDVVVVTRLEHTASSPPDEWFLTGYGTPLARRWLRYAASPPALTVTDSENRVVWQASAAPTPAWASAKVMPCKDSPPLTLGDKVWFRVSAGPGVRVEWFVADGVALSPATTNDRFGALPLNPEQAAGGYRVRVGLVRGDVRATSRETVRPQCWGLAHRSASCDEGWRRWEPGAWVFGYQARRDAFRVFTGADELGVMLEGYEVHGRCDCRPRRLNQLLGTGAPLDLAGGPYNLRAGDRYRLAAGANDTGIVTGGKFPQVWPGPISLTLLRPIAPREGHFVLLWSNRHGLHRVGPEAVTADLCGGTWSVLPPWDAQPEALLAAIGFENQRLGGWWFGQYERYFSTDQADHPGLKMRNRLALVRWLRLPALRENKWKKPCLEAFAHAHPADLLAVGLFDRGLEKLSGDLELRFERTTADRLAFDAISRQLLLDAPVSTEAADEVSDLFDQRDDPRGHLVDRLFPTHPVLAARVAMLTWADPRADRHKLRTNIREHRFRLAGLPAGASVAEYQLSAQRLLAGACRTFAESNRVQTNDGFVEAALVRPGLEFVFQRRPLGELERSNLLVALGSGDFRLYLGLRLLKELEDRL